MYPSDLTDKQWQKIQEFFKRSDPRGARSKHNKKAIMNAILYVAKGGIQWRMLPKDMPPWQTVYNHFWRLNQRGIWEIILKELNKISRKNAGKDPFPSYAIIDSQSVKTQYHGSERGFDGGKKNKRS
jgi:putative transposase